MNKKTVWILTEEYNDYNQHGGYFVKAFEEKPTEKQLSDFFGPRMSEMEQKEVIGQLLKDGNGKTEDNSCFSWFMLAEEPLE